MSNITNFGDFLFNKRIEQVLTFHQFVARQHQIITIHQEKTQY